MPEQPFTFDYPARALYGPRSSMPDPQLVGDKALYVVCDAENALYQVQSGNWVLASDSGGGGGPGSDTSAVHRNTSQDGSLSTYEQGSAALTGALEIGHLLADWGMMSVSQAPPFGFAAAINAAVPITGGNLAPGDQSYSILSVDWIGGRTVASTPVVVTIPDPAVHGVRLSWDDQVNDTDAYPSSIEVYRNNNRLFVTSDGTATGWDDTGTTSEDTNTHPPSSNQTGGIQANGPIRAHGTRPVAELGATAMGVIVPDTTIVLYDSAGTPYYIPAKAV